MQHFLLLLIIATPEMRLEVFKKLKPLLWQPVNIRSPGALFVYPTHKVTHYGTVQFGVSLTRINARLVKLSCQSGSREVNPLILRDTPFISFGSGWLLKRNWIRGKRSVLCLLHLNPDFVSLPYHALTPSPLPQLFVSPKGGWEQTKKCLFKVGSCVKIFKVLESVDSALSM